MTIPAFNSNQSLRVVPIGRAGEAVVTIENASVDPAGLVDFAATSRFALPDPAGGYPGHRRPAGPILTKALVDIVDPVIRQVYPIGAAQPVRASCNFSLVTVSPDALQPLQRLPHIDTPDPLRFAMLLYLCPPSFGGTAFYRQVTTGLEQVGPADHTVYLAARQRDLAALPDPPAYPDTRTPGYVQTAVFAARPNRLLLYRSCSLHSGVITPGYGLSPDPQQGRLTLNLFLDYQH